MTRLLIACIGAWALLSAAAAGGADTPKSPWPTSRPPKGRRDETYVPTEADLRAMRQAAPTEAPARCLKARTVLVWGRIWTHTPNGTAARAVEILGRRSGAYKTVISDTPEMLRPETLKRFDAIVLNNLHEREPLLPDDFASLRAEAKASARKRQQVLRRSLLDFVAGGKGAVGIHAATAACQTWPEYGRMMGGYYGGHINQDVAIKLDLPEHPINACFQGKGFRIRDEVYIARQPYSRKDQTVLGSLDLTQMTDPGKRPDKDYAISWIRRYGKGRVFYCTLGHEPRTYHNGVFLRHMLAAIQFATGDLKVPAYRGSSGPPPEGSKTGPAGR